MRRRRHSADPRRILGILGVEPELQDAIFPAHLLVIPVVIAVVEFGEIGMALDKSRLRLRDHPVRLRRRCLLRYSEPLAEPGRKLKSHSGAWDTEAMVNTLPDRIKPLVEV